MKVVFLENVKGVAKKGEVKEISDGYFMNFLQPKKLAVRATSDELKKIEERKKKEGEVLEKVKEQAMLVKNKLDNQVVEVVGKADDGKLYAAVTNKELEQAIFDKYKIRVKSEFFAEKYHIKTVGTHKFQLNVVDGVSLSMVAVVKAK